MLPDIESAESDVSVQTSTPRGRIRVDMPGVIGRSIIVPRLREFEAQYPDIELVLGLSDRPSDLIYEGIDCAIRTGARCAPVPISIVYPQARATAAIRTFVDWVVKIVGADLPP